MLGCAAPRFDCLALVKPQFEVGRERVGKGGVVRVPRRPARGARGGGELARDELGLSVLGFASSGLPGPAGNRESFVWIAEPGREGARRGPRGRREGRRSREASPPRSITVFTGATPPDTAAALRRIVELAAEAGGRGACPRAEVEKLGLPRAGGMAWRTRATAPTSRVVLGGDGTILTALRRYAGRDVPVFAVNYGAIGFLATVEQDDLDDGVRRALAGDFEVLALPALTATTAQGDQLAVNDISFHRRQDGRVAELGYSVRGEELGQVRCDGLVVATAGGLDRLQPRQRRPGAGLGRRGLRGVVHRAAHAHRAGARGGARATCWR